MIADKRMRQIGEDADLIFYMFTPSLFRLRYTKLTVTKPRRQLRLILSLLFYGGYRVFYAYDKKDGKICAYSVVSTDENRLRAFEDNALVVGPEYTLGVYRRRGYATRLKQVIADRCSGEREYLYICIADGNTANIHSAENAGFRICGRVNKTGVLKKLIPAEDGAYVVLRKSIKAEEPKP